MLDSPRKSLLFTVEERVEMFRKSVRAVANLTVEGYSGLTVGYAHEAGAAALVRGLRATSDFDYEYQMTTMNQHLQPAVETVFMMTSLNHAYLSSSLIKEVAGFGADLAGLVPDFVAEALAQRLLRKSE